MKVVLTRRGFLAGLGALAGGLTLGIDLRSVEAKLATAPTTFTPGPFLHLDASGAVFIVCSRSEMGQGIRSSLPVLIADELGADWQHVRVVQGDGNTAYGSQNTDGSRSVRDFYQVMRVAGATARAMLIAAAAKVWKAKPETLQIHAHAVHHPDGKRVLGFGELVATAARLPVPKLELGPPPKDARAGKPLPLIDAAAYVTGTAAYAADISVDNMLIAVIARPPVVGGKVATLDDTDALAVTGVRRVVRLPEFSAPAAFQPLGGVAVLADHTWAAISGRRKLAITWDHGAGPRATSASYQKALSLSAQSPGTVARKVGNVDNALAAATKKLVADYWVPFLVHAPMEPPAALARFTAADATHPRASCEVWAATQNPQAAQAEVARVLGLTPDDVTVHVTFLGGGFGRKSKPDYCAEAAWLSREVGAPVRVQWTRTDDIQHSYYHAASAQHLEASIDDRGAVTGLLHRVASPPIGSTFVDGADRLSAGELAQGLLDLPLLIPAVQIEACAAVAPVRIGWMRSVYNINHAFATQSFIAELAHTLGRDHKALLLELLGSPRRVSLEELGVAAVSNYGAPLADHPIDVARFRAVIERVTADAGWANRGKRALGLAVHRSFLTYVAVVAEVALSADNTPRVVALWLVADPGTVVNPDRVASQLEGAVVFATSLALHSEVTITDGMVDQTNFRDYQLARIGDLSPAIHVTVLPSTGLPGGVGEPGVPPVAPAIANAIFALTGQRLRSLPLRPNTLS